jgi:hypothetical protein
MQKTDQPLDPSQSKQSKPPMHPSLHLPQISPMITKPRFSIFSTSSSKKSNLGRINSSLTPNSLQEVTLPIINSSRSVNTTESSEEVEMTDIERIIQDQMYFKKKRKNRLIKSTELEFQKEKPETRGKSHVCESFLDELVSRNLKEIKRKSPEKVKKLIVPDIPKTKFGVHKDYNDLKVENDFKTVEVVDKPLGNKFKSRIDTLGKEQEVRMKILSEIVSTKRSLNKSLF